MEDIVNQVLEKTALDAEKYKPITVQKHLELDIDLGTLLAIDNNDLNKQSLGKNKDNYLLNLTRDNTQLLINSIWELPTDTVDEEIVAQLPAPKFILPRARQIPKPRPLTKWEQFAKEKGIQKKKKNVAKKKWDDELQKWIPLYGHRRAQAERQKDWVLEVPQNIDPNQDMFTAKAEQKSERVAKNELQRLRNIAKHKGVKVPRMGITSSDKLNATQLSTAVTVARASTASIGKFQARLPKEKDARGKGVAEITPGVNRKRKAPFLSLAEERERDMATVKSILNKRPLLDIEKAVNTQIRQEQQTPEVSGNKKKGKAGNKTKKGKGKGKGTAKTKPAAGKGQRNANKRTTVGRKRR